MIKPNPFSDYCVFDLALALYHFLQHNWQGIGDPMYRDFCVLTSPGMYKPAMSEQYFENIQGEIAFEVYGMLNESNYDDALQLVLNYEAALNNLKK